MSVKKYNHVGEAFHAYFKCKWPLSALSEPYLMSDITGGSVEEIRMTFFLNMAATFRVFLQSSDYLTICWLGTNLLNLGLCHLTT